MWANYVEEVVTETQDGEEVVLKDQMQITITELADAVSFFYTENNSANATAVEAAMAEFNAAVP